MSCKFEFEFSFTVSLLIFLFLLTKACVDVDYFLAHDGLLVFGLTLVRSRNKELHRPTCYVCKNLIPVDSSGQFQYRSNRFWQQKYCPTHARDGTHRCCSCRRLEPRDTAFSSLTDGRKLCLDCLDSSIMNTDECQPLYREVCEFYENLNMKVYQTIPLYLVERQVLNEVKKSENNGHHLFGEIRGVTMTEGCSINAIVEQSRIRDGNETKIKTRRYKLVAYSEVIGIIILYGFPRLLTGRILAHEMMHAWLRLEGYPFISPEVEEGLCEVMAHMWLESQISFMSTSHNNHFEKRLAEYLKYDTESRTSHPYGTGFRRAKRVIGMYGLKGAIDYIRMTDTFPR